MVASQGNTALPQVFNVVVAVLRSRRLYYGVGILVLILAGRRSCSMAI